MELTDISKKCRQTFANLSVTIIEDRIGSLLHYLEQMVRCNIMLFQVYGPIYNIHYTT